MKTEMETVVEGLTTLLVPPSSLNTNTPPKSPAFYNPHASLNRDISILIYHDYANREDYSVKMADALSGVGSRGVRVAVEVSKVDFVHLNDLNPYAISYAQASAKMNNVFEKCRFSTSEACSFLIEHSSPNSRFDIVDLDPFGSPSQYLDCALRAIREGGMLSFTATDTAVLCGVYPDVAYRRYYGRSLRTEYCHEIGIRLLYGFLAFCSMRFDLAFEPIFAHSTRHYFRIYSRIVHGAKEAEEMAQNLGYIFHCFNCGERRATLEYEQLCPSCKKSMKAVGPLWLGPLYNSETVQRLLDNRIDYMPKRIYRIFELAYEEALLPPTYILPQRIADELNVSTPSLKDILEEIRLKGYHASRTAINLSAVRTDAPLSVVKGIILSLVH